MGEDFEGLDRRRLTSLAKALPESTAPWVTIEATQGCPHRSLTLLISNGDLIWMRHPRPIPCRHGLGVCAPCYRARMRPIYGLEPEPSRYQTEKESVQLDEVEWVYPPLANARRRRAFRRWAKTYPRVRRARVARRAHV